MEEKENEQIKIASPGHRIGAVAVDAGLYFVTFGIGWFIWNLVTMANGQSPGKNLVKVRVLNQSEMKPASWGQMFIRQGLIPLAMSLFYLLPFYIWIFKGSPTEVNPIGLISVVICFIIFLGVQILDLVWFFGAKHRRLIDYWAKTIVVNEARN